MKLSPKQKQVIKCLRNGYVLITGNEMKGAIVGYDASNYFYINNGVFWRLVDKGLIWQQFAHPQDYVLTELGKKIKI